MTAPDYGDAFAAWRSGAGEAWRDYTRHAFVEELRAGTLPQASYLHYLRQDYVFLIHFARAWALAAAKAETLDEIAAA
ncbi:MAG: thiaminase II, partial [Sulfitobacter sp.]